MVKSKIREYIVATFMNGEGQITDDEQLFESGIIDSIGSMDISEFSIDSGTINGITQMVTDRMT